MASVMMIYPNIVWEIGLYIGKIFSNENLSPLLFEIYTLVILGESTMMF